MAGPLSAALVVASLCMPPSPGQATGYFVVEKIQVIEAPQLFTFNGITMPFGPPLVRVTGLYWRGTDPEPRVLSFVSYESGIRETIRSRFQQPDCVPPG